MILFSKIILEELSKDGKNHKWDKCYCGSCRRDMWGHGYVTRYFASIPGVLFLKRYRCPECSVVVTTRPDTHWPYLHSAIAAIYQALKTRICSGVWPVGFPRQRGGHWLKKLVINAKMSLQNDLQSFLEVCFVKGVHFFS